MYKDVIPIPMTIGAVCIVVGAVFWVVGQPDNGVSSTNLRDCMEIATEYRRAGDGWLHNAMNDYLKDDVFTTSEYIRFKQLQREVENKVYMKAWKSDSFQFMEKDGIGINRPEGYIK